MMRRKRLRTEDRRVIYQKCNGHCAYCGCNLKFEDMQIDHMIPLRRDGVDTMENMLPACKSCNHYKSTLTAEEFRDYVSEIPDRLQRDSVPYRVGIRFGILNASNKVEFFFERGC